MQTNINFLEQVVKLSRVASSGLRSIRLARKNAHLALARFSEAFQLMRLEPNAGKVDIGAIHAI
jgi:hypothetical protein